MFLDYHAIAPALSYKKNLKYVEDSPEYGISATEIAAEKYDVSRVFRGLHIFLVGVTGHVGGCSWNSTYVTWSSSIKSVR